jgi:hypothetical protein
MIKMLISFISLFIIFYVGIELFRQMTKREKWSFVKLASYSIIIAVLTMIVLVSIVILF